MAFLGEDAEQAKVLPRHGALHQRGDVDAAAEEIRYHGGIAAAGDALDVELGGFEEFLMERSGSSPRPDARK